MPQTTTSGATPFGASFCSTCDGEGVDDLRLLLDDGTAVLIDAEFDGDPESLVVAEQLGRARWPRLRVLTGGRELWPFDQD